MAKQVETLLGGNTSKFATVMGDLAVKVSRAEFALLTEAQILESINRGEEWIEPSNTVSVGTLHLVTVNIDTSNLLRRGLGLLIC